MFGEFLGGEMITFVAIAGVLLIPISIIWVIYAIIKANNERKVKLSMVEQGLIPEVPAQSNKKGTVIMWACSLIGLGAGFALSTLFVNEVAQIAIVVAMLGIGMLGGYFLRLRLAKSEPKNE